MTHNIKQASLWDQKLVETYEMIIQKVNSLHLLKYPLSYKIKDTSVKLKLGDETYNTFCSVVYTDNDELESRNGLPNEVHINYVNSTLGSYTGQFLFYLQLLCGYLMGINVFSLENYTNVPERAAIGIYKLFEPAIKNNNITNNFKEKQEVVRSIPNKYYQTREQKQKLKLKQNHLRNLLQTSDGEMKLIISSDFFKRFIYDLQAIKQNIRQKDGPWNIIPYGEFVDHYDELLQFITNLFPKQSSYGPRRTTKKNNRYHPYKKNGGKRGKTKRRFTKRK